MRKLSKCNPKDFLTKAYFLAPAAENRGILQEITNFLYMDWFQWRKSSSQGDGPFFSAGEMKNKETVDTQGRLSATIQRLAHRFHQEIPRHSPRYIGHMYSEFSLPAYFGHLIALIYNPNNIASESSRVGVKVERESIRSLAKLFFWPPSSQGHFTSCGTIANLEFFYRLKTRSLQSMSEKTWKKWVVYVPESAHYSWAKAASMFSEGKLIISKIPVDELGEMSSRDLEKAIFKDLSKRHLPAGVISICGSTEIGAMDPIQEVNRIIRRAQKNVLGLKIWHHVDGAYGGFLATFRFDSKIWNSLSAKFQQKILALESVDSITLDPHKLGYSPYSVGCFLSKSQDFYQTNLFGAKYVNFKNGLDPGPFTIEGSRSAAGALAMHLTVKSMGWKNLARIISRSFNSAKALRNLLAADFHCFSNEESNIVCFTTKGTLLKQANNRSKKLSQINEGTAKLYQKIQKAKGDKPFYVSKTCLSKGNQRAIAAFCQKHKIEMNCEELFLIRCTIMNPFISSVHTKTNYFEEFVTFLKKYS